MWMTSTLHGFAGVSCGLLSKWRCHCKKFDRQRKPEGHKHFITQIASINSTIKMVINNAEGNEPARS